MKIVGVINVTPDSLSDGGNFFSSENALKQSENLFNNGADLVELGGQSTRPGSQSIGEEEEIRRILPCLKGLKGKQFGVDTYRGNVAQIAVEHGAVYINDIMGGHDQALLDCVARNSCEIILMYSKLVAPHVFGEDPTDDIVETISEGLSKIVFRALRAGIKESQIILDTGMGGFISSNPDHSYELLARYNEILDIFPYPFMLGVSRKGFLGKELTIAQRDEKSKDVVSHLLSDSRIKYLRVHEVSRYYASPRN